MSTRDEVIAAAESLTAQGRSPFSPADVLHEARRLGCSASDMSIRTAVIHNMRVDTGTLRTRRGFAKVGSARYVLADPPGVTSQAGSTPFVAPPSPPPTPSGPAEPIDPHADWYWEGNVQAAVVRALASDGWDIVRVAHTATKEHGIDIEARKDGQRLVVEVKGYPGTTYSGGANKGLPKPTTPPTQARSWFSTGILSALVMRGDDQSARVVAAFPDKPTYQNLASKVSAPLLASGVEIWLVNEAGTLNRAGMQFEV
jgi:hypothetical protein